MSREIWFCPNIGSDIVQLFEQWDEWFAARQNITVFKFYAQHILSAGPIGNNTYEHLLRVDAFRKLKNRGIEIAVEMGAVKPGSACDTRDNQRNLDTIMSRVGLAGAHVRYIAMDEPLVSRVFCRQNVYTNALYTHDFMRHALDHYDVEVGWIEAWPQSPIEDFNSFLRVLRDYGTVRPSFLHLDIDRRRAAQDDNPFTAKIAGDFFALAHEYNIPRVGIILAGYDYETDAKYATDVRQWAADAIHMMPWWDDLVVQSWAMRTGAVQFQDLPANLPMTAPHSHLHVLMDIARHLLPVPNNISRPNILVRLWHRLLKRFGLR